MSSLDSHPSASQPSGFRLSLLGLFVLILGVATGLGIARLSRWSVLLGICVATATWLIFGLSVQVRDLWRFRQHQAPQLPSLRAALAWAIVWRMAAVLAMSGYIAFRYWQYAVPLPFGKYELWDPDLTRLLPDALLALTLLATLRPILRSDRVSSSLWRHCVAGAGFLAAAALCVTMAAEKMLISYLVHVSIRGVEAAQPYRWQGVDIYRAGVETRLHADWMRGALAAALLLLVSALLTYCLAQIWRRGARARIVVGILLAGTMALLTCEMIWACWVALPRLSPFLYQSLPIRQPLLAGGAVAVIAAFSSAAAWRLSACEPAAKHETLVWRPAGRWYYHEFVVLLWLPFLVILFDLIRSAWQMPMNRWAGTVGSLVIDVTGALVNDSPGLLWLPVFLAAIVRWLSWLIRRASPWPDEVVPLTAGKFAALWLAIFWTTLLAAPTVTWLASAVWLAPHLPQP